VWLWQYGMICPCLCCEWSKWPYLLRHQLFCFMQLHSCLVFIVKQLSYSLSLIFSLTFDTSEPQLFWGIVSYWLHALQILNLKAAWVNLSHWLRLDAYYITSTFGLMLIIRPQPLAWCLSYHLNLWLDAYHNASTFGMMLIISPHQIIICY